MGEGSVPNRLMRTERARKPSGEGSGKTIGSAPAAADTEGRKTKKESAKKDTAMGSEGGIGRGDAGRWEGEGVQVGRARARKAATGEKNKNIK